MSFTALAVYDLEGNFLGWTIGHFEKNVYKLHTTNLWQENEGDDLKDQLLRLNDQVDIKAFWPDVREPEVQALLNDPNWAPVQKVPVEVPDNEKSLFVYLEEPREEDGFPGRIDEENSVIVYTEIMVPSPADNLRRVKQACEIVARERASLL